MYYSYGKKVLGFHGGEEEEKNVLYQLKQILFFYFSH